MSNHRTMSPAFEREKNIKAATYTTIICAMLLVIFFYAKWTLPQIVPPPMLEVIEVNLGNSDEGLGDIAPQIPGEPSASKEENYQPPATSQPVAQEQNITGDENEADDAPVVNNNNKPVVKNDINRPTVSKPRTNTQPVADPTPVVPKPKAVYTGGTNNGPGGNGADSYNNIRNQGIAGGHGDQGSRNGNPNSDSYSGNASNGNSGVRIRSGLNGRKILRVPKLEDDFNENAKVAVDVVVNAQGKVVSATVNLNGTTTPNSTSRRVAVEAARKVPFSPGSEEQRGTIIVDLKVNG